MIKRYDIPGSCKDPHSTCYRPWLLERDEAGIVRDL